MDARDTPELGSTARVPRVRIKNVTLVRPIENLAGHCSIFSTGSFDMRESSSNMNALIKKMMEGFRDAAVLMDSKRISCQQLASKSSWVPDSLRKSCYVCTRSFGPTRHRHHCRLCGEVVCKKCLVIRNATVAAQPGRSVVSKLKVCMFCPQD
ncbi:hypothetical protein P43SY_010323 [Pythium insidiosum]|uniref:FYVE-type domain-containing protein n=1 Tax=Pythium insidiosum TaxID=114742 RepID=A0AAD5LP78_PYTIN|nr:hypothetical protein P43SY_010323 [Pythium insidiosum]